MVVGLRNDKLSEKLQMNSGLTLEQAVQQARQSENVKKTTRSNPITPGSSKHGKPHSFEIGKTYRKKTTSNKLKQPSRVSGDGPYRPTDKLLAGKDADIIRSTTSRLAPPPLLPKVQAELKRMEDMEVTEKLDQPTEWCFPVVVVPKKHRKVRICGDSVRTQHGYGTAPKRKPSKQ